MFLQVRQVVLGNPQHFPKKNNEIHKIRLVITSYPHKISSEELI